MEYSVTLTIYNDTKKGRVTDTTDYSDLGFNLNVAQAKGLGTIYFNGEIIQQKLTVGDPLINLASGATYFEFDLELDSNGEAANGTYMVVYSVRMAPSGIQFLSSGVTNILIGDGSPEYAQFLEAGDTITLNGTTDADVVIETVDALVSGNPSYTLTTSPNFSLYDDYGFDVTHLALSESYTYQGCTLLSVSPKAVYDCDNGDNGTFTFYDDTDFSTQTLVSRSMTGSPPTWATEITAVTTANQSYTINRLATGTWTVALTNVITYTQSDGLILIYTATATIESIVTCAGTLCGLNACIESLRAAHQAELTANGISKYQKYVDNVNLYYIKAQNYKECAQYDEYRQQVALIEAQLDEAPCECNCCDDDELKYIYNTSSATQAQIDVILEQLDILQNVTYNKVLFLSPFMFATSTGNTNYPGGEQTYIRPFSDLSEITIDKKYFDAEPNGYAKKFVEIEITAYTDSATTYTQVVAVDGETLFTSDAIVGNSATTRYLIRLTTISVSGLTFGVVTSESFQIDNSSGDNTLDSYFNSNTIGALWDVSSDLVLDLTPNTANPDKIIYTNVKITAIGYE